MTRRRRGLPLLWSLLLPFLAVLLVVGVTGALLTSRALSSRARATLSRDIAERLLKTEVYLADQGVVLADDVDFASHVEGLEVATIARSREGILAALRSVTASRDLDLLVVSDTSGAVLAVGAGDAAAEAGDWAAQDARRGDTSPSVGIVRGSGAAYLVVAGRVGQGPAGFVVTGARVDRVAREAAERSGAAVTVRDVRGTLAASSGTDTSGDQEVLTRPLTISGRPVGTLAVSVPSGPAFTSARGVTVRVGLFVLAAMLLVVGVGIALTRDILRRARPLVAANRSLGAGDLTTRVATDDGDEFGAIAVGFNALAESVETARADLTAEVSSQTIELEQLYDELVRTSTERAELFAAISHELRTPLFALIGNADLLADTDASAQRTAWWHELGRDLEESAEMLIEVVDEMADIARLESGGLEVTMRAVAVADVLARVRGPLAALARQHDIALTIADPDPDLAVLADGARLRQVIVNLASNAVKYNRPGGRIDVHVRPERDRVRIAVADTGVGIPKAALTRVFDPFYRVKGTTPLAGQTASGLGLALTQRLVEAQGGTITVTSRVGRGSTFHVALTRVRDAD